MSFLPRLDPNEPHIRLLALTCSVTEEILRCTVYAVSQASCPKYIALSYVWGDGTARCSIGINGETPSITTSLDVALRNLWRQEGGEVLVWADAICINQADVQEKASQVRMMGHIFSNASEVWIWIGESADDSDLAMELVGHVADMDLDDPNVVLDPESWRALWALMRRPWWRRIWVVQEAMLAKKATVNCGHVSIDIECFIHFKDVSDRYRFGTEPRLRPIHYVPAAPFFVLLSDWNRCKEMLHNGGIPLGSLLSLTGGFESTLKRDKVFALLGVATAEDRKAIQIDYDREGYLGDLLLNFSVAVWLLARKRLHNCLSYLQWNQELKSMDLPSWVPDYTIDDPTGHFMFPATESCIPYSAGADNAAWAAASRTPLAPGVDPKLNSVMLRFENYPLGPALVLPGLIVDTISISHRTPTVPFYQDLDLEKAGGFDPAEDERVKRHRHRLTREACKHWQPLALEPPNGGVDPYQGSPGGRYEAFWRTLIADREFQWEGPPNVGRDFGGRFEAWKEHGPDDAYVRPYSDAAIVRCMGRSFFITQKGYLGLGPSSTAAGDVVYVLRGGHVPFVLRRSDDKAYSLIGEAYVHGIMDGNVVREAQPEDLNEIWIC